jgi:Flp pilus assembly protein TadG
VSRPCTGDGRGQSLVEFALILPVLCYLLLGAVDFARVASVQQRLEQGVHLATLRLMKDASYQASTYDVTSTLSRFVQQASGLPVGTVTAITHYSTDANGDDQVVVTAQYGYPLLLPGLQGVRTGRLSDGKLQITVQAAGLATTSVPTLTASFNGNPKNSGNGHSSHIDVQVTTPSDATTAPSSLMLVCHLENNQYQQWSSDTHAGSCASFTVDHHSSPSPDDSPTTIYTATLVQNDGIASPPVTCTVGATC